MMIPKFQFAEIASKRKARNDMHLLISSSFCLPVNFSASFFFVIYSYTLLCRIGSNDNGNPPKTDIRSIALALTEIYL